MSSGPQSFKEQEVKLLSNPQSILATNCSSSAEQLDLLKEAAYHVCSERLQDKLGAQHAGIEIWKNRNVRVIISQDIKSIEVITHLGITDQISALSAAILRMQPDPETIKGESILKTFPSRDLMALDLPPGNEYINLLPIPPLRLLLGSPQEEELIQENSINSEQQEHKNTPIHSAAPATTKMPTPSEKLEAAQIQQLQAQVQYLTQECAIKDKQLQYKDEHITYLSQQVSLHQPERARFQEEIHTLQQQLQQAQENLHKLAQQLFRKTQLCNSQKERAIQQNQQIAELTEKLSQLSPLPRPPSDDRPTPILKYSSNSASPTNTPVTAAGSPGYPFSSEASSPLPRTPSTAAACSSFRASAGNSTESMITALTRTQPHSIASKQPDREASASPENSRTPMQPALQNLPKPNPQKAAIAKAIPAGARPSFHEL